MPKRQPKQNISVSFPDEQLLRDAEADCARRGPDSFSNYVRDAIRAYIAAGKRGELPLGVWLHEPGSVSSAETAAIEGLKAQAGISGSTGTGGISTPPAPKPPAEPVAYRKRRRPTP